MFAFRNNQDIWLIRQNILRFLPESHIAIPGDDLHTGQGESKIVERPFCQTPFGFFLFPFQKLWHVKRNNNVIEFRQNWVSAINNRIFFRTSQCFTTIITPFLQLW